ncbi:hypothetical protein MTR_6g047410 [Medicago truncatula]|uniref:Uncharacterized protein n=1 Tax=Medicago truncatula TaxID=3880 RepID=A0A072UAR5_MEDTR|nr:hypothetical protein MTR_6g047410 [Medicago truncatula]
MASSSSVPGSSSSNRQETPAYEIKGRTMFLEEWDLKIQTECPVDFVSLAAHNCDIGKFYNDQGLGSYFNFLNGPTYQTLVRHFWVRASIFDREAAKIEEDEKVLLHPELKGKTREEMGLEPYSGMQIRSSIMGIPVCINEEVVAYVLRRPATGDYKAGITIVKDSPWNAVVNQTIYNKATKGTSSDMTAQTRMMLKIQNENLLPKGGGSDQPSLDHKILLHYFITGVKANVPRYIFRHMVQQLRESQLKNRCWVPYGRLLSEIFHQRGLIDLLEEVDFFIDNQLGTVTGKIINAETLRSMHLISAKDVKKLSTDMTESNAKSALMKDFPPICKQDPLDVQMHYIREHFEKTKVKISLKEVPEQMYGGALPVAKSRKTKSKPLTNEEYLVEEVPSKAYKRSKAADKDGEAAPKSKKAKTDKTEGSSVSTSEEVIQKKRNKEPDVRDAAREAALREKDLQPIRSTRAKGERSVQERLREATEQTRTAREFAKKEIARRKQLAELYRKERDDKLKAAGYEVDAEKADLINSLAAELEKETIKEGAALLKQALKAKTISGATSPEAARPEAPRSEAPRTEAANPKVHPSGIPSVSKASINIQTFSPPSSPSSSSSSNDSDDIPLSQHLKQNLPKFKQSTTSSETDLEQVQINFSKHRVEICENLLEDHPFQPPNYKPLNTQTTSEDPQQHETSTLHNLEKHLGGEMQPTPTKASKTVPEKTVLENQPETSTSQEQSVLEQTVLEQVASELPQTNQPTENLNHSPIPEQPTTSDQPSSSHSPQIPKSIPISDTILESEFIDEELQRICDEIQGLVLLRKVPSLSVHYEDQWMNLKAGLKKDFAELLELISEKCITTHAELLQKRLDEFHSTEREEGQESVLLLANTPFFSKDDYVSRGDRIRQGLKRRLRAKDEETQKAKQKSVTLEEVVNKKVEELKHQDEQIKYLMEQVTKLANP